jgi:threonine/homoserine/homoserine lactone efflux protein
MAWSALRERGALRVDVDPLIPAQAVPDATPSPLIPANAGIQSQLQEDWTPACAGASGERAPLRARLRSDLKVTIEAILINILNPKLSIFFFAFLPQFVLADEAHPLAHMAGLSAVFMLLTFVVFVGYGLFAAAIRTHVISRPRVLTWMRRTFAAAFVALGAKLALAER